MNRKFQPKTYNSHPNPKNIPSPKTPSKIIPHNKHENGTTCTARHVCCFAASTRQQLVAVSTPRGGGAKGRGARGWRGENLPPPPPYCLCQLPPAISSLSTLAESTRTRPTRHSPTARVLQDLLTCRGIAPDAMVTARVTAAVTTC